MNLFWSRFTKYCKLTSGLPRHFCTTARIILSSTREKVLCNYHRSVKWVIHSSPCALVLILFGTVMAVIACNSPKKDDLYSLLNSTSTFYSVCASNAGKSSYLRWQRD
jgi:hypothetical protein